MLLYNNALQAFTQCSHVDVPVHCWPNSQQVPRVDVSPPSQFNIRPAVSKVVCDAGPATALGIPQDASAPESIFGQWIDLLSD